MRRRFLKTKKIVLFAILFSVGLMPSEAARKKIVSVEKLEPHFQTQPFIQEPSSLPVVPSQGKAAEPLIPLKKVTLDVQGMDLRDLLKFLSQDSGINIIPEPGVQGAVTLDLKNVEFWESLRLIAEFNNLAYIREGANVVRVMTASDYLNQFGKLFNSRLETRLFPLNYSSAEEILAKINSLLTKDQGIAIMDKRSNRILVTDTRTKIENVEMMIRAFDVRHKEVRIDAKIVQVTLSDKLQFGVNWENIFNSLNDNTLKLNIKADFRSLPLGTPAAGLPGITATVGTLRTTEFNGFLDALQSVGKTNILSSPRITAMNNQEAKILVGTKEAFVTTTVINPGGGAPTTTAEAVNFIDVGVKLFVTPAISEDGFITMKIRPEVSSVDRTLKTAQGNVIPIVRTSEAETSVVVKDGNTIVIAGLIEDKKTKETGGVPFLSRIPLLGIPFRSTVREKNKTELVIFLSPTILSGDTSEAEPQKEAVSSKQY